VGERPPKKEEVKVMLLHLDQLRELAIAQAEVAAASGDNSHACQLLMAAGECEGRSCRGCEYSPSREEERYVV